MLASGLHDAIQPPGEQHRALVQVGEAARALALRTEQFHQHRQQLAQRMQPLAHFWARLQLVERAARRQRIHRQTQLAQRVLQ